MSTKIFDANKVYLDDNFDRPVIAVMEPTGCGKSHFIDPITELTKWSGTSLKSVTQDVRAIRIPSMMYGVGVALVDTPGFDDTCRSDVTILELIGEWLEEARVQSELDKTLEGIHGDHSTDQEEVTWDSILGHIESSTDIDSLSAFQGWLAPHLPDVLCYLQDLIPLNILLDVLYERNDFAGAKELTRHLQLRGHDRELMIRFRAFLYERKLLPQSPQLIFKSLTAKASFLLNKARQVAKEVLRSTVDDATAVLKTIYAPDTQKYPPIESPGVVILQSFVKISDGIVAISLGSIRYSFF